MRWRGGGASRSWLTAIGAAPPLCAAVVGQPQTAGDGRVHKNNAVQAAHCGRAFTDGEAGEEKCGVREGCSKLRDIRACLYVSGNYPVDRGTEIMLNHNTSP